MSDFDKEAERERLREKYEHEQEKRKSTEQMSELLLKGATMTNAHCNNCGDPIFRYDGEEFCPTCQQPVASADEAPAEEGGADADEAAEETASATDTDEAAAGSGVDARADDGAPSAAGSTGASVDSPAVDTEPAGDGQRSQVDANGADVSSADAGGNTPARAGENTSAQDQRDRPASTRSSESAPTLAPGSAPAPEQASASAPSRSPRTPEPSGDVAEDFSAARESLTRTLLTQARQAEHCEDPRRAKDHLAAAREAAEALSALSSY
jgi:uncharacterized Zn finger protein (UPF0148 family)